MMVINIANVLVLFAMAFMLSKREETPGRCYWPGLIFKIMCGLLLGLIYHFYYRLGDTLDYYNQGKLINQLLSQGLSQYLEFLWSSKASVPGYEALLSYPPRALFFSKIVSIIL